MAMLGFLWKLPKEHRLTWILLVTELLVFVLILYTIFAFWLMGEPLARTGSSS